MLLDCNEGAPAPFAGKLHVFRNGDSQDAERTLELGSEVVGHPEQKDALLAIFFGQHCIGVIEIVERLRELECIFRHVRW